MAPIRALPRESIPLTGTQPPWHAGDRVPLRALQQSAQRASPGHTGNTRERGRTPQRTDQVGFGVFKARQQSCNVPALQAAGTPLAPAPGSLLLQEPRAADGPRGTALHYSPSTSCPNTPEHANRPRAQQMQQQQPREALPGCTMLPRYSRPTGQEEARMLPGAFRKPA